MIYLLEPNIRGKYLIAFVHVVQLHQRKAELDFDRVGRVEDRPRGRIVIVQEELE